MANQTQTNIDFDKAIINLHSIRGCIGVMHYVLSPSGKKLSPLQDDFGAFLFDIHEKLDQTINFLTEQ